MLAAMQGRPVAQPGKCRTVKQMVTVSVVARDGLSRTQVQLSQPGGQLGWTDAVVPGQEISSR